MLSNNSKITSLMYENMIEKYAKMHKLDLQESKEAISVMSFKEYLSLLEASADIVPPSGNPIGKSTAAPSNSMPAEKGAAGAAGANKSAMWPGKGTPVQQGMTVSIKGPDGMPVPGQITQVDNSRNAVAIKNPMTGQDEWHNNDALEPFKDKASPGGQPVQQTTENKDIARMRQLAGIAENCSGGATGAGAIAIAPTAMGSMKKRQEVDEAPPREYTPKGPAKTIIGDTKPGQASGELSANLAVRGKKTASRTNNGFKR